MKRSLFLLSMVFFLGVAISLPGTAQARKLRIVIATGGTGGAYYPLGAGMAKIIEKYLPGIAVTVQVTGGAMENARLINSKKATLGFAMADTPYFAYLGKREWKGHKPMKSLRIAFAGHVSVCQIVVRADSGIKSLKDLEGKKIGMGNPGGSTKQLAKILLKIEGVKHYKPFYASYKEQVGDLKDDNIDAGFIQAGVPTSSVIDLTSSIPTRFLSVDPAAMAEILKQCPYYIKSILKAGTYKGQNEDVVAIGSPTHIICNAATSPKLIYSIVKVIYEHIGELAEAHPAGKQYSLKTALRGVSSTPPLDPGAAKYFREVGLIK